MIYTSYYAQVKNLVAEGIEPIAISRGKPKGFSGRALDCLAPTWEMIRLDMGEEYHSKYMDILAKNDPHALAKAMEGKDVALLCYEKDINDCHRKYVRDWLREAGYECEEYQSPRQRKLQKPKIDECQATLF